MTIFSTTLQMKVLLSYYSKRPTRHWSPKRYVIADAFRAWVLIEKQTTITTYSIWCFWTISWYKLSSHNVNCHDKTLRKILIHKCWKTYDKIYFFSNTYIYQHTSTSSTHKFFILPFLLCSATTPNRAKKMDSRTASTTKQTNQEENKQQY